MDLMVISSSLNGGGSEKFVCNLVSSQTLQKIPCSLVICLNQVEHILSKEVSNHCLYLNAKKTSLSGVKLLRCIQKKKPKQLLITSPRIIEILPFLYSFLPKNLRIAIRLPCIQSQAPRNHFMHLYNKQLLRWICKKKIKIICQSDHMRQDLIQYARLTNLCSNRFITVIYNPVLNQHLIRKKETHLSLEAKRNLLKLLYVGRLSHEKGLDRALLALAKIKTRDWQLSVLGQGPLAKTYQNLAKNLGIDSRIDWLGFQPNPSQFYISHDVLLMPSRTEGFPNTVLEATAVGLPVIAFDSPGGIAESLGFPPSPPRGILVPDGAIDLYAKAIEDFQSSDFCPEILRAETLQQFELEKIATAYLIFLELFPSQKSQ